MVEQEKKQWDNLKAETSRADVHDGGRWWWEEEQAVVRSNTDRGGQWSQVQMRGSFCSDESHERRERKTAGKDTVENQIKRLGQSRTVLLPASSPASSSDLTEMTILTMGRRLHTHFAEPNKCFYNDVFHYIPFFSYTVFTETISDNTELNRRSQWWSSVQRGLCITS